MKRLVIDEADEVEVHDDLFRLERFKGEEHSDIEYPMNVH
jgi:hypothetical protein